MEVNILYMDPMGNTWIHTPPKMFVENEPNVCLKQTHCQCAECMEYLAT